MQVLYIEIIRLSFKVRFLIVLIIILPHVFLLKQVTPMKQEEIHFTGLGTNTLWTASPVFLIEVFIRTVIVYIVLLFVVPQL